MPVPKASVKLIDCIGLGAIAINGDRMPPHTHLSTPVSVSDFNFVIASHVFQPPVSHFTLSLAVQRCKVFFGTTTNRVTGGHVLHQVPEIKSVGINAEHSLAHLAPLSKQRPTQARHLGLVVSVKDNARPTDDVFCKSVYKSLLVSSIRHTGCVARRPLRNAPMSSPHPSASVLRAG